MSQFNVNTNEMKALASELKSLKRSLRMIARKVSFCSVEIRGQSIALSLISRSLGRVVEQIESESVSSGALATALLDAAVQYQNAEGKILGTTTRNFDLLEIMKRAMEKFIDLLKRIGILKGGSDSDTSSYDGDPVDVTSGNYVDDVTELRLYGPCGLCMVRHYNSKYANPGSLGIGWTHNYEISLAVEGENLIVTWGDQTREVFESSAEGVYRSRAGSYDYILQSESEFVYYKESGRSYRFNLLGELTRCDLRGGKGWLLFEYGEEGLSGVTDSYGNRLDYTYNEEGLIDSVSDHTGRKVSFTYENECLVCAEAADTLRTVYEYDESGRLGKVTGPDGIVRLINEYDEENRVVGQKLPDGSELSFSYEDDKVLFTDRNGAEIVYVVDELLRIKEARYPAGVEKFAYNKYNKRTLYTDLNGASYYREYDAKGNILTYTDPLGNTRNFTYDEKGDRIESAAPDCGLVRAKYDDDHNMVERMDSLGNKTCFTYKNGNPESITYPDGSRMEFTYDEKGRLRSVCNENGNVTSYIYDDVGRKVLEENGCGESTRYEYDEKDRYRKITNALGQERTFFYEYGRLCRLVDFDGFEERWEYDKAGHMAAYCDKAGRKTQYAYDCMGNVNLITLPDGEKLTRTYDAMNRLVKECGPGQRCLTMEYDPNGNCIHREENGYREDLAYDALGRIEKVINMDGTDRTFTYDGAGRMTGLCREDGLEIHYDYDTEGRLLRAYDSGERLSCFEYDQRGRLLKRTGNREEDAEYKYYPNGLLRRVQWQNRDSRENEYDGAGRLIRETYASGYSLQYSYDALGRRTGLKDNENRMRSWKYDAAGNVSRECDSLGRTTSFSYSPTGKLVYMRNALGNEFRYGYDSMDRMTLLLKGEMSGEKAADIFNNADSYLNADNDRVHLTKWVRTADGQIAERIDARGNRAQWTYRPDGQPLHHTDAEGRNTNWQYDEAMRLSAVQYSDQQTAKYSYNKMGWITGVCDWSGELSLEYDTRGRLTASLDRDGQKVQYDRDPSGRPLQVCYPDGTQLRYSYNESGQTCGISAEGMQASYKYDSCGRLQEKSLILEGEGSGKETKLVEEYAYWKSGKLKGIDYKDGDQKRMSLLLFYDDAGNMTDRFRTDWEKGDGKGNTQKRKYEYDGMNRVRRVYAQRSDTEKELVEEYKYDEFGNCVEKKSGEEVTVYEYNVLEQLVRKSVRCGAKTQITEYTYDREGRLIREQGPSAILREYNAQGNLAGICSEQGEVSFDVNSLGAVIAESHGDGSQKKFWLDYAQNTMPVLGINTGSTWESYVRDTTLAAGRREGKWGAFVCDERGSVLQYLDQNHSWADLAGQTDYDTFGNVLRRGNGQQNRTEFGYTGLYRMPLVSTWKTMSREYDPSVGRFLSRDRDEFLRIREPETMHQYLYCFGNPMIWVDPEGTDCYIFYLPEFEHEAKNDRRQLAKQYGYDESHVHMIPIDSNDDFRNGWNNMGTVDGQDVDIDTVLINTHGSPNVLADNNNFNLNTNSIRRLQDKDAENVIILGCNSGHKDYADSNPAAAFAEKTNGAPVLASDGTVYSGFSLFNWFNRSYSSRNDRHYRGWRTEGNRDNAGWVVYQEVDGEVTTTDVNDKKMTVTDMVKELRKHPRQAAECG